MTENTDDHQTSAPATPVPLKAFMDVYQQYFPYPLTGKQQEAAENLCRFLFNPDLMGVFILRGYAGTGKTLMVSTLVKVLKKIHREVVLLAPTGRAAKVFTTTAGTTAYTIHKHIYRQRTLTSEESHFDLDRNNKKNALFIIDESSMISARTDEYSVFGSGNLFHDLLNYIYRSPGCRALFVGDNAQLPPVGDSKSPALTPASLTQLDFHVSGFQLTEVLRQEQESGILYNATQLRRMMKEGDIYLPPIIRFNHFPDLESIYGDEIIDTLQKSYDEEGTDNTIVLTRTNKQANAYNKGIRSTFFDREGIIQKGDKIMVVRNNYFWTETQAKSQAQKEEDSIPMNFLANGDIGEITHVEQFMEFYGLHFADVSLCFPDYDHMELKHVRVLLDTLDTDGPALSPEKEKQLFLGVSEDYADIRSKKERMKKIREDLNFNALQIKFAYAVTCHKAQGGQWKNVFLDQGWLPPDSIDINYYRWLYTAFTRPTQKLYLISWPKEQTEE